VRLVVTHDPLDARALASRILVIEGGRLTHDATYDELVEHPRTRYVAELVGINAIEARSDGTDVLTTSAGAKLAVARRTAPGDVVALFPPRAVALHTAQPSGSPRNIWEATVDDLDRQHDTVRVRLTGPIDLTAEITAAACDGLALRAGERVWVSIKALEIDTAPE
jgi:molybdate transport system ATP-binding protein